MKEKDVNQQLLPKFMIDFISGGISASISKTATAPLDRVKIILQTQSASAHIPLQNRYAGILDILRRVPKEQGFFSFWRGNWANILRYFPLQALNFAFKDYYREFFLKDVNRKEQIWKFFIGNLLSGGVAGATSLCFVYPLDFARTRLAVDVGKSHNREFNGLIDCLKKIIYSDGIRGVYRGFFVSVQCIFIYRASYFGMFDTAKMFVPMKDGRTSFFSTWALAQVVTTTSGLMAYPWDTVRRRMMMQSGRTDILYTNSWNCLQKMIKNEGVHSLYNGALSNVFRSVGGALVLTFYEQIQNYRLSYGL